jgi:hypothetical protein
VQAATVNPAARTIMTSTLAFILFALAATLLWWLIDLVPSDDRGPAVPAREAAA